MPTTAEVNAASQNFIDDTNTADAKINGTAGNVTDRHGTVTKNLEQILLEVGFLPSVAFAAGLAATSGRFTVTYNNTLYAADPSSTPFTTTATFDPDQWNELVARTTGEVNLEGFGAQGGQDCTAAIDVALATVQSLGGGTIKLGAETYQYNGTITMFPNLYFRGQGRRSKIQFTDLDAFPFEWEDGTEFSGCGFYDLTLDGTSKETRSTGCFKVAGEIANIALDDVWFEQWNPAANSGVVHVTTTGAIYSSRWGTVRFTSGLYNGHAIYDEGGGPCWDIDNIYTGNSDGETDIYIGVVGSNMNIGSINVGGASGRTLHSRGTTLSSLNIGIINHESSASPNCVVELADTQANIGPICLSGSGEPDYGVRVSEEGYGTKVIHGIHGSKATAATNAVQIATNAALQGTLLYKGASSEVTNSVSGTPDLTNVISLKEGQHVSTPESRLVTEEASFTSTDASDSGVLSYPLASSSTYHGKATFVAVKDDGSLRASFVKRFTVRRDGTGNATMEGSVVSEYTQSTPGWSSSVDTTSSVVRCRVQGAASTTIKWRILLEMLRVDEGD